MIKTLCYNKNFLFIGLMLFASFYAMRVEAQYTYFSGGIDLGLTSIHRGQLLTQTTHHRQARFSLSAMHRPLRFLALGISYHKPLTQGSSFSFSNAPVTGGYYSGIDDPFNSMGNTRYLPQDYRYEFTQGGSLTLECRFIDPRTGVYGQLGYTFSTMEELFVFQRKGLPATYNSSGSINSPAVSAENIRYQMKHNTAGSMMGFGWLKGFQNHVYIDFFMHLNFQRFPTHTFSHKVSFEGHYGGDINYVTLKGQATGMKTMFSAGFKMGYFF